MNNPIDTLPADPVEPTYTLHGRDPVAYLAMLLWAAVHQALGTLTEEQVAAARIIASRMEQWAQAGGQNTEKPLHAWTRILSDAGMLVQSLDERSRSVVH
jgi:hypothetical protein